MLSQTRSSNGSGPSGEAAIELLERFLLGVIHKEPVHQVQKTVARGAFHCPLGAQRLIAGQDLLGHDVERSVRFRFACPFEAGLQALQASCKKRKYFSGSKSPSG